LKEDPLKEGEKAKITQINSPNNVKEYLLTFGITTGTVFTKNYSPKYTDLVSITLGGKMLSIRKSDYKQIEWVRI